MSLHKNSLKPNAASHNATSWYTDTDGFLEHSSSRRGLYYKWPALQKRILFFFGGGPLVYTGHKSFVKRVIYIFLQFYTCLFFLLITSFTEEVPLIFMMFYLSAFYFVDYAFSIISKNSSLSTRSFMISSKVL